MNYFPILLLAATLLSCSGNKEEFDASGSFEAEETIISAEVAGVLKEFTVEEGQQLRRGEYLGYIDSTQLYLQKRQLQAQIGALVSRKPDIPVQLASLQEELRAAEKEQKRISNLLAADAATQKQLDDINARVAVLRKQIAARRSALDISSESISKEAGPVELQIARLSDQLSKCLLVSPMEGTVLAAYAEPHEMTAPGKPLYKIADLSSLLLRAYVTGGQLSGIRLGQRATVLVDSVPGAYREYEGTVEWISGRAEFTPKTIQTRDERANLVYAVRIRVRNDGSLKEGMYAEVKF